MLKETLKNVSKFLNGKIKINTANEVSMNNEKNDENRFST